jgi:hypothetical protein
LQTAGVDVARDDAYGYVDGVLKPIGLLLEGAATNLITDPEFTGGFYANSMSSLTIEKGLPGIFGTDTAIRLYGQVEQGQRIDFDFFPSLTGTFTASLWAETNSSSTATVTLKLRNISPSNFSGAFSRYKHTESLSNQWGFIGFLCTAAGYLDITFELPQLEEGSYPTSYIPTQGSQVTRAADVSSSPQVTRATDNCVRVLGDEFNTQSFTAIFSANIPRLADSTLTSDSRIRLFEFNDGEPDPDRITVYITDDQGGLSAFIREAGSTVDAVYPPFTLSENGIYGIKVEGLEVTVAFNGEVYTETVTRLPTVTKLIIGSWVSLTESVNAPIKNFRVFPTALSDAELITLTGGN